MSALDRRAVNFGLLSAAAACLPACSGGTGSPSLAIQDSSSLASAENVTLKPDGLPEMKDLMQAGPLGDKSLGKASAPVTIIKYASMTCPYCREFHLKTYPTLKRDYINKGKVRYILREFPIGKASGTASLVMRCAGQNDDKKYFALYDKLITKQKVWVSQDIKYDAIFKVASEAGVSRAEFDACLKNQTMIDGLKWVKQRGRRLGVIGTPTLFINGKKERGRISVKEIQGMIAPYLS